MPVFALRLPVLAELFQQLDAVLVAHRHWWQFRPFHQADYPWAAPELSQWLNALNDHELWDLDRNPEALAAALKPWLPAAPALQALLGKLEESTPAACEPDPRLGQGVPGRKWAQITHFVSRLVAQPTLARGSVLEWCAGKGHLGRLLASQGFGPVHSCEWQAALCAQGRQQATHWQLDQHFTQVDVMAMAPQAFPFCDTSVALHACGDLHRQLLTLWAERGGRHLALAPCCYHLQSGNDYRPMSALAKASTLSLDRADLSFALQATVTGGERTVRLRDTELHWRMAFDEWQQTVRQCGDYLPLPTLPKSLLTGAFEHFMAWAAARKQLPLDPGLELAAWLQRGLVRAQRVRRMELVAKVFRRPLELWLVLDRALYLQERGLTVQVSSFCDYAITPRNYLILAQRKE